MTKEEIKNGISKIEDMFPYKEVGNKDSYSDYNQGWADACGQFSDLIDSLPSETANGQWIDAKTALPEDSRDVYVSDGKMVSKGCLYYETPNKKPVWMFTGIQYGFDINYWMEIELPAPPITGKETEK